MPGPAADATRPCDAEVLVVGVVRNCSVHLRDDVARLKLALNSFRRVHWLLVESDSDDDSVAVLAQLAKEVWSFRFLTLGSLKERMPSRTERIAHCRNAYLDEIVGNEIYADVDFVIVADFDGVNTLINEAKILSCWQRQDWDVCTANQNGPYYDVWALRHPDWSPNDCWRQRRFLKRYHENDDENLYAAVFSRMITIPENADWIEVDSAFGGLAIYRRAAIIQGRYVGLTGDGNETCEHVAFHQALKTHGCRIFINPQMINAADTEHTQPLLQRNRLKSKAMRFAKILMQDLLKPVRAALSKRKPANPLQGVPTTARPRLPPTRSERDQNR